MEVKSPLDQYLKRKICLSIIYNTVNNVNNNYHDYYSYQHYYYFKTSDSTMEKQSLRMILSENLYSMKGAAS